MSASIETRPRRSRHETEPTPEPVAPEAEADMEAGTVTAKAEGIAYTLPRRTKAGDVHTDNSALVCDLANARQYVSFMASQARSRAKKFAIATTDAEREANKPFTLDDYRNGWPTYVAKVAVRTGEGAVETMQDTATWNAWLAIVAAHDALVTAGKPGLIAGAKDKDPNSPTFGQPTVVPLYTYEMWRLPRNADVATKEKHAAALIEFNDAKHTHIETMQSMPRFADAIAKELAMLQAAADAKKAKAAAAVAVATAPRVSIGNLLDM